MPIPALDKRGLLPDGVYDSTLQEVEARFCFNPHRRKLWAGLMQFAAEIKGRVSGGDLILAGSFFSDKPDPDDIEATIVTGFDAKLIGEAMLVFSEHDRLKRDYHVDYYPSLPGQGQSDFVAFFQYVGPKTAQAKNLQAKDRRGVVRVPHG